MQQKAEVIAIQKKNNKKSNNHRKAARTRRQRGYHWEDTIVKRFQSVENWNAFRLGSPSTALPDVLAVNTQESTIFTIEAKSGTTNSLPVPADQIERCARWVSIFDIYKTRNVLLAFKFLSKKRTGLRTYESRELREFYKIWNPSLKITNIACNYDGKTFGYVDGKRIEIELKDYKPPFTNKSNSA